MRRDKELYAGEDARAPMSGVEMSADMTDTRYAEQLLTDKFIELGRLPVTTDFSDEERSAIKSALGPWPRALEKAELKPVSEQYLVRKHAKKERRRHRKQRRRRNAYKGSRDRFYME